MGEGKLYLAKGSKILGGGLEVRAGSKTDLLTTSISNPGALLANLLLIGKKGVV